MLLCRTPFVPAGSTENWNEDNEETYAPCQTLRAIAVKCPQDVKR